MKTYKKILFGLIGIVIFLLAFVSFAPKTVSAEDAGSRFWGECVDRVLNTGDGNRCASIDDPNQSAFTYSTMHRNDIANADYQGSNTDQTRPGRIVIWVPDVNGRPMTPLNFGTLVYAGTFTSESGQQYFAYRPLGGASGDFNFRFLVKAEPNPNNTYQLLALVYNELQSPSAGPYGDGFVYAWPINKYILLSAADGSPLDPGPSDTNADNSCEAMSSTALEWIMCPIFKIAEATVTFLLGTFESLLKFSINEDYERDVKPAWSAIKNIVSALVVIVMLVMIFAQAASIGPIDAYTIRKLLPRIVAAVILIQISWYLFAWVINAVNDIGIGLQDLLKGIFARTSDVDINDFFELLANAGIGAGQATALNWLVIIPALAVAAVMALPMLLLAMLTAVVALLVVIAVLIFRMILILTLLLASPLALLAWVLPNTEKYWKMWWDNFLKVLFMFPIIILIIMAGRIFAYVAGQTFDGLLAFFIVVIGFFGPLFLLPKSYKWGGSLMQFAGQGISRAGVMATGKESAANKYFRNRQGDWKEQRLRGSYERMNRNAPFRASRFWQYPLDRFRSGKYDPLKQTPGYRAIGQRSQEAYIAKGAELEEADVKASDARLNQLFKQVDDHDSLARAYAAGDENYQYDIRDEHGNITTRRLGRISRSEMQAGLNAVARFSGNTNMRYLDSRIAELRGSDNGEDRALAKRFLDANVQSLQPRMKHFYYGPSIERGVDSFADNLSESSFEGMDPVAMETMLGSLSQRAVAGDADAARRLSRVLGFHRSAIDNETIHITAGVNQAVEAFVDGQNLGDINTARADFELPAINPGAAAIPAVAEAAEALRGRIDVTGRSGPAPATGGELRIEHTELDTSGAGGTAGVTPRNEANVQNELINLRRRVAAGGTLSADEQRRLEQIRNSFPHL